MVGKTKQEALAPRNAILDAAELVCQERGVGRASLAEIAAAAGVTRGAIYWHFANKLDLFDAMVQRVCGAFEAQFNEMLVIAPEGDPVEPLRQYTLCFLDRLATDPQYYRITEISWHKCEFVGEIAGIRDKHMERGNRYIDLTEPAFRVAQERGYLSPGVDPRTAAVGLLSVVSGLIANWTLDPAAFPLVEIGAQVVDIYLSALRNPKRPAEKGKREGGRVKP
ncbi:MAG: TetR family transcriptional regulator [Candidatus Accumulibacter sp.]|jgi:TetR/AcrR family acrAB operon transcriptional repressor|nr:TetR family transcriptional regulator [Accumulibacter sp.]